MALWPQRGTAPMDAPSKSDYFDSLFHSAAVFGLNTSALIEGGGYMLLEPPAALIDEVAA